MNGRLKVFAQDNYKASKSDLFAMFIERNLDLGTASSFVAMITMQSWMFLTSFENLRTKLLNQQTLISLAHLGPRAFDSIGGEVVSTVAFVLKNASDKAYKSSNVRLVEGRNEQEKMRLFAKAIKGEMPEICHLASAIDFKKIPGSPFWRVCASTRVS